MPLVAGVDSSTQYCKVVVRDAETGALVRQGRAPHPPGTEVDPYAWWEALRAAVAEAGLVVLEWYVRSPYPDEVQTQRLYVLAGRPAS